MPWLAVNKIGTELIFQEKPERMDDYWTVEEHIWVSTDCVGLPSGSIKKLTGQELTWEDEPVKLI